jgi:hypothetical protein
VQQVADLFYLLYGTRPGRVRELSSAEMIIAAAPPSAAPGVPVSVARLTRQEQI